MLFVNKHLEMLSIQRWKICIAFSASQYNPGPGHGHAWYLLRKAQTVSVENKFCHICGGTAE